MADRNGTPGGGTRSSVGRLWQALPLVPLLCAASCAGLDRNDQGRLQPQTVQGPCEVKKFFLLPLRSVPTDMTVSNAGPACTFTLFDLNLQVVLTAALVTEQPTHGTAAAELTVAGRRAAISYAPRPGYTGPDRFSVTLEPGAVGVTVNVAVQPPAP